MHSNRQHNSKYYSQRLNSNSGGRIENLSARLILEDGTVYEGFSFGYPDSVAGEVVFSTGMTGYPEGLTDPSFFGQILVFTYPLVGNYGMPPCGDKQELQLNYESLKGQISALVVDNYSEYYAHHLAETSLAQWLYNQKIPAIANIDTRALTQKIREKGVMLGKVVIGERDVPLYDPNKNNLVEQVSISDVEIVGKGKKRVLLLDCGSKHSIVSELQDRELEIIRVPWNYPVADERFDGMLISSGPGDPKMCSETIGQVSYALENDIPTFGICLGHQMMALALGADTFKMKYGHRSQNQPVVDTQTGRAYITSQNHGYAVDLNNLPKEWSSLFTNINDNTCEGLTHKSGRFFSTQFHPEASPGPVDTRYLFDKFLALL